MCVTETLWVLSPYLDRRVCCMRCCLSWSQGTGCRRAAGPGCRRSGSGNGCHLHRSDCRYPTLPRSPTPRPLKHNSVLSLSSSPLQDLALVSVTKLHRLFFAVFHCAALMSVTKLHLLFFAVFRYAAVQTSWELRPHCMTMEHCRSLKNVSHRSSKLPKAKKKIPHMWFVRI